MSETFEEAVFQDIELLEAVSRLRRRRGRPRKPGLYPDEVEAALHGLLGSELQCVARILVWLDVNLGGRLPRRCDFCQTPYRYRLDRIRHIIRLYCEHCQKETSINIGVNMTGALNTPIDEEGQAPEPPFDRCPRCGGRIAYDWRLDEWFCQACWATVSGLRADWIYPEIQEESSTPQTPRSGDSEGAPYPACPACGAEGSLSYDKREKRWICRRCGANIVDFT